MPSLQQLSAELCDCILSYLERPDLRHFRLVSRECASLATPHVFKELFFDLEPGGCNGLAAVAKSSSLADHVRIVHLQRRSGLKVFSNFGDWCNANIHTYIPHDLESEDQDTPILDATQRMSREEWIDMEDRERQALYEEYKSECAAVEAYMAKLALAMSSWWNPNLTREERQRIDASDAGRAIHALSTISSLLKLHSLAHTPSFEYDHWGRTWRNVEFHPTALIGYSSCGNDPNIEALQLYLAVRSVAARSETLRSVALYTMGNAMWSVPYLVYLFDWGRRARLTDGESPSDLFFLRWDTDIGGPKAVMDYTEGVTRDLVAVERSMSHLTSLQCRINTIWSNEGNSLVTIAKGVSRFLCEARQLENLELIYREDALDDDVRSYTYFNYQRQPQAPSNLPELARASNYLLVAPSRSPGMPLRHLRRLHLSLVTGAPHLLAFFAHLQHLDTLRLNHVVLIKGSGHWETVLTWLATHCHLSSIDLHALEDVSDRGPRLLLDAGSSEWAADGWGDTCYVDYANAIVHYVLRRTDSLPILSPTDFLDRRAQTSTASGAPSATSSRATTVTSH